MDDPKRSIHKPAAVARVGKLAPSIDVDAIGKPAQHAEAILLSEIDSTDPLGINSREIDFESKEYKDLAESILKNGLKENLVVTKAVAASRKAGFEYTLISGFRRYQACEDAGMDMVLCVVEDYGNPIQALVSNAIENLHRENLSPYEVAVTCKKLRDRGLKNKQVAQVLKFSEGHVSNMVTCVEQLIPELLEVFKSRSADATVVQLIEWSRKTVDEQKEIYQRLAQLRQSRESGFEQGKPEGKTRPSYRMIGATKARLIVNDLKIAKAVRVGDQVLEIDARSRAIADVLLRRVLGELKVDPLVLPEKENDAQEG